MTPKFTNIKVGDNIQFNITVFDDRLGKEYDIRNLTWSQAEHLSINPDDGSDCCMIIFNWFDGARKYQDDGGYQNWMYELLPNRNMREPMEGANVIRDQETFDAVKRIAQRTFTITSIDPFTYI